MEEAEKIDVVDADKTEEAVEETIVEETEAEAEVVESSDDEAKVAEEQADEGEEKEAVAEAEPEKVEEPAEELKEEKESEMDKEIAKEAVVEKASPVQAVKSSDYLKSKEALVDFKNIVMKFHRGSNEQIMKAWQDNLKSKAITGDDILPARIEQIFFKTWTDKAEILNTFRTLGVRSGAIYAMKATANGTALAHEKGATKLDQSLEAVRRDLKGLGIYKKLPIDLQDLFDDETGELLAFRVEELAGRVAHAIVVGAIVGGYSDNNGRGLFSMKGDLDGASAQTPDDFGSAVATVIANSNTDTDIDGQFGPKTENAVKYTAVINDVQIGKTVIQKFDKSHF